MQRFRWTKVYVALVLLALIAAIIVATRLGPS
jgi:hypothetical protein